MAGGKIDILVNPDVKEFPGKLESGLRGGIGTATKIGGAIGAALGGAATIKGIANIGVEFDKQMNTMAAVSQASAAQLAEVEDRARELGKSADLTATSASDAAAAMVELTKGGFTVQQSMDAAKGTLQLASAAQIDAAEAATIQSQALQAFGLDASYAATASDVLAGAANASSAEIGGIALGLQQSGSVAHQFGLTIEDNATALAMLANAGIQGSDAGTLLKTMMLSFTKDTKPAREAIEDLGLTIYDANGEFVGLEQTFGELSEASGRMTEQQYQAASAALFGSDAMRISGIAAEQGAEGWRENYAAVTRAGQASEVAAAQAQGLPGILEAVQNQAEDTGIAIYDAFSGLALEGGGRLIEMLETAGPMIEGAATNIASGIEAALPTVERVVGVVGTGLGEITSGLGVLADAGVSIATGVSGALTPAAESALSLSENLNGMTGPLMVAGAALALGKWRNWGGAVDGAASKVKGLGSEIKANQQWMSSMGRDVNKLTAAYITLEEKIPVVGRMGDAYRDAADPMRQFSSRQRELAATAGAAALQSRSLFDSVDLIGQQMGRRATARVADFAGTLRGALAASLEGTRTAARGVVDALGGGWNIVLAGAAMAIAGITSEIDKTHRSTELMRDLGQASQEMGDQLFEAMTQGDLTGELSAVTSGIEGMIRNLEELEQTAPGAMSVFTAGWKDITGWFKGDGFSSGTDARQAQLEVAESAKLVTEALEEAGITAEEAGAAVGGSVEQYDALISMLDLSTEEGRRAAEMLREQRDEYLRVQELTESLAPVSVELSDSLAMIGDEAATSEDKVSALSDALDSMLGIDPTADEAVAGLHEEIDQVTEAAEQALDQTKGWGESLFGEGGGLDLAQENSRELRETLLGMRDSLEEVAVAGEDVHAAAEAQGSALDALADQYGISRERVRELADEMGLVPSLIESTVAVSTHEALSGLEEVWGLIQANQIEAGKPLPIEVASVEDSKARLEDLGWSVEVLHKDSEGAGAIEVTADTEQAITNVDLLVQAISQIDPEKGITFHSNSPEEIEKVRQLGIDIEDLGNGEYRITSNTPEEIQLMIDLGLLVEDEKTGQVTVNSNLVEVLENGRKLDERDGRVTEETHKIVTQREERVSYFQSINPGMSAEAAARQQGPFPAGQTGGRFGGARFDLPAYAGGARHAGYRLPEEGPGTDEVDGFLALDAQGVPSARLDKGEWVINGVSSEEYDRELAEINAGVFPKLPGYASGDRHGATSGGAGTARSAPTVPDESSDVLDQAQLLGDAFAEIPEEVTTTVTLNAAGVGEELLAISEKMAPLDEGETITVDAVGDPAMRVLTEVGVQAERLPDGSVEITATDTQAVESLDSVGGMLTELGETEVSPVALMDTTELEVSADDARRIVDELGIQEPTPRAQIIIDQLLEGKGIAQGELEYLGAMSPTPQSDLNNALLDQGVQFAEGELQRVGDSRATSVVDANNESALRNIQAVIDGLNSMPVKRTIEIVAAGSAASALQGRATGGRIPKRAMGGRLPTTGPGTDQTDGILGVGSDGVPTSWVDAGEWVINGASSERYDRELAMINAGTFPKLDGFEYGGRVGLVSPDQLLDFAAGQNVMDQQAARSLQGALYDWGGVNWGDCSGAMSGLARFATGLAAFGGRFATMNQEQALSALGFISGLGPSATSFNVGWFNGGPWGGHTAGDIGGTAVEMGGGAGGNGKIGGAAASASHPQFTHHAHLPLGELWAFDYYSPIAALGTSYQAPPDPYYQTEGGDGVGPGGMGVRIATGLGGGVDHTSTEGLHLKNGTTIPWEATQGFATGGRLPTTGPGTDRTDGILGVGSDGVPTARVDAGEWVINRRSSDAYDRELAAINSGTFPRLATGGRTVRDIQAGWNTGGFEGAAAALTAAASRMGAAAGELERAAFGFETTGENLEYLLGNGGARQMMGAVNVTNFGGEWVREAEVVKEAETNLADTRATVAGELGDITTAEDDLAAAQKRLAEARKSSGEVSVTVARRIEDAEADVADARADGDAEKFASAEQKLSRAREDAAQDLSEAEGKQAEEIQKALEDVAQAEAGLTDARVVAEDQTQRLEQAEREVIAARFQAIADLANQAGEAWSTAATGFQDLFSALADQARIMEQTRQNLVAEQIARQTADLQLQRSRLDAMIAEQDIARTRAEGAISVVEAEMALAEARDLAALKGATGIDAMSEALDRARETGEFAVADVAQSVIDNAAEVRAAEHAVEQARAQAALDELTAVHAHRMAVLDLAQATLTQQKAVGLVDISTRQLAAQAAQLGGLTAQGAQRASSGWGGLAQAGGGLGKLLGGLAGGAAGFAAGGPLGALLGGGAGVIGGVFDILGGVREAWNNRGEIAQSFEGMSLLDKVITGGGIILGGGAAAAGAYAGTELGYGPELAGAAAELGAQIAAQSAGYAQGAITSDLDRINSLADEERSMLELQAMQEQARIDQERMRAELDYLTESTALQADVEIAELLGQIAMADTTEQADALANAAIVAAERRDQMLDVMSRQLDIAEKQTNRPPTQLQINIPPGKPVPTWDDFETVIDTMNRVQNEVQIRANSVSGAEYQHARTH